MDYFENEGLIVPVEQTKIFSMVIAMADRLIPCDVYFATMEDANTFTRVIINPGTTAERLVDVDRQEGLWVSIYEMEPTVWSELVADALNYHIAQHKKDQNQQN